MARYFAKKPLKNLQAICTTLGASIESSNADLCALLPFLPQYPVTWKLWLAEEEDEIDGSGRLFLNSSADHYLSVEDAVTVSTLILNKLQQRYEMIHGVQKLRGATYSIIPDQIEAGTYMVAAAATGGDVTVKNVTPKHLESISAKLVEMGVTVEEGDDSVRVVCDRPLKKCNIKTMPHPGFPTDMQPQITTLLSIAHGTSMVSEGIFDSNRFKYVDELLRMGAQITVDGKVAIVEGVSHLKGAPIRALDLRAGAAMVIAGLAAEGVTQIEDIQYIERGYENIVEKLVGLGADIYRSQKPEEAMDKIG